MSTLQTEFEFELPQGYRDEESGEIHKTGLMRLATAADEIQPVRDPRVQQNPAHLSVILLSRVITKLGNQTNVSTRTIEALFAADFAYLQDLYNRINQSGANTVPAVCPSCGHGFEQEVPPPGEG